LRGSTEIVSGDPRAQVSKWPSGLDLGADWTLGATNIVVGPRFRLDGGVGDGALAGGSLLLDAGYWFR
jgi:hypothetical protein